MKKIEQLEGSRPEDEIKQCIYDLKGYCKEGNECKYLHAQENCLNYFETGTCIRNMTREAFAIEENPVDTCIT